MTVEFADDTLFDGGNSSLVTFQFSEAVSGFDATDVDVTNGSLSAFTMVDTDTYTATFTADDGIEATGVVDVDAGDYTDVAGNLGGAGSDSATIDTANPDAPSLALVASSDTGVDDVNNVTQDDTPTLRVTLNGTGINAPDAGDTVTIYSGVNVVATYVLTGTDITNDFADVTTSDLGSDGVYSLTAKITDQAGNDSPLSNSVTVTVDQTAPTDITWTATSAGTGLPTGVIASLSTADADSQLYSYTLVSATSLPASTAVFSPISGNQVSVTGIEANKTYTLAIHVTDLAGNQSSPDEIFNIITGSNGSADTLPGTPVDAGDDILYGLGNSDIIFGGTGDDTLFGQDGNDTLAGGADEDSLDGGAGVDVIDFSAATGAVSFTLNQGDDAGSYWSSGAIAGLGTDGYKNMEGVTGSAHNDTITGSGSADLIRGGDGVDSLSGGEGDDLLDGGLGSDTVNGDGGNDDLTYGAGDTFNGGAGFDILESTVNLTYDGDGAGQYVSGIEMISLGDSNHNGDRTLTILDVSDVLDVAGGVAPGGSATTSGHEIDLFVIGDQSPGVMDNVDLPGGFAQIDANGGSPGLNFTYTDPNTGVGHAYALYQNGSIKIAIESGMEVM
jgi:hypothetical protein